ncbi:MAG: hypothetical protein IJ002_06850 [Clostridia bacterium]|nr:hypothetical protein [Clostridia bacterium]
MNNQPTNPAQRKVWTTKYAAARANLLAVIVFTAINIIMYFLGSQTMFLFSASVPYFAAIYADIFREVELQGLFIACIVIAVIIIAAYLLCWIFSKKHCGWLVAALVMFAVDTVVLAFLYFSAGEMSGVMDVLFHVWVLYYLITGVSAGLKLKKLPEETPTIEGEYEETEPAEVQNTPSLRMADMEVKSRTLLEANACGKHICYRRVKRVNELVINGYVYAEFEALVEPPHELVATLGGHTFAAGTDKSNRCYINVDGETVVKKIRWY